MNGEVESETPVVVGDGVDVTCPCGQQMHLWWNGGELDARTCKGCGRWHSLEHRAVSHVVHLPAAT